MEIFTDEYFMRMALQEARKARDENEIPIGAVVVANNQVIGKGYNLTERFNDVTAHAEMQALTAAAENIGGKYLKECTLYVTVEPCVMCAGALFWSQIGTIVYGTRDEKRGFLKVGKSILHPKTILKGPIMEEDCAILMTEFFKGKRK